MSKLRYTVFNEVKLQLGGEVIAWAQCPHGTQVVLVYYEKTKGKGRYQAILYNELSSRFYDRKSFSKLAPAYLAWQAETELNCWRYLRDE